MTYKDFGKDLHAAIEEMGKLSLFQRLHNELRNDFNSLQNITEEKLQNSNCPELIRSCLKELFSLIEADIYYLNVIQPYNGYKAGHKLSDRFFKTYQQHCNIHNYQNKYNSFIENYTSAFETLKEKRHNITHPKSKESIEADKQLFEETVAFFKVYTHFVTSIMQDVGVSFKTKSLNDFTKALRNRG